MALHDFLLPLPGFLLAFVLWRKRPKKRAVRDARMRWLQASLDGWDSEVMAAVAKAIVSRRRGSA